MSTPPTDFISAGIAVLVSSVITFIFARYGKNLDAREQAQSALLGIPMGVITEQNKRIENQNTRISQMNDEIDKIWQREHDCRIQLTECSTQMREAKTQIEVAQQRLAALERKIDGK